MSDHLSELNVGAFVDGTLSGHERKLAEQHLAECAICRNEVAEVVRLVRPRRRRALPLIPLAAAAAVVLIVIGTNGTDEYRPTVLRSTGNDNAVRMLLPAPNQMVPATATFVWHAIANAEEYRLTITSGAGDVVAEKLTSDTATALQLAGPATFRWYVTAILQDGSVISSAVRTFRAQ